MNGPTCAPDEYGGSFENRLRFIKEVAEAIRAKVGPDMVIGLRISGDDHDHNGLQREVRASLPSSLCDGIMDFFNVIAGSSATLRRRRPHRAAHGLCQHAYVAPFAATVKAKVKAAGLRRRPDQPAAGGREDPSPRARPT